MATLLDDPLAPHNDRPARIPPPPPPPPSPPSRRRGPGPRYLIALIAAGVIGGGSTAGVLAASGALDGGTNSTTTVVRQASTSDSSSASSSGGDATLDAAALYSSTASGVVDITVKTTSTSSSPFGQQQSQAATATGTGFVIDKQGRIVTAAHVVDDATSVTVSFQDGTTRKATVLGVDDATDLAVIDVDSSGLTLHPLKVGSSSALRVGDGVVAIGDPFQYERSLSSGLVSGLDRSIEAPNGFTVAHAIQTDAAVNPGNSGGPLLAADGSVVGVIDQIATDGSSEQSSGVGFAVPSDIVSSEVNDLIAGRTVKHAYLGVASSDASGTSAGALVGTVTSGSPAADAGVRQGDIVTAVDGKAVKGSSDLVAAVADHRSGDKVQLTIKRGSSTQHVSVTLATQPASSPSASASATP